MSFRDYYRQMGEDWQIVPNPLKVTLRMLLPQQRPPTSRTGRHRIVRKARGHPFGRNGATPIFTF
jgi:hypothetical protein